jgi:hypothetical protein
MLLRRLQVELDREGKVLVSKSVSVDKGQKAEAVRKCTVRKPFFAWESRRLTGGRGDFADFSGFIACNDCVQLQLAEMLTAPAPNCTQ